MTARPATTRRASQPPTAAVLVAVVLAVLAIVVGAAGRVDTQASTTTGQVAGTRVRASTPLHQGAVEAAQAVVAGQGRETTVVAAGAAIGSRVAPQTAGRVTNGTQFETLSSQPISGVTRSAHRATANKQLLSQLEADPALRQFYDDALGTDVMAHMQSGRSGLLNPPGTQWHHPTWDPDSLLLLRTEVHRHPLLQPILHPGARGGGGWAEFYGGP